MNFSSIETNIMILVKLVGSTQINSIKIFIENKTWRTELHNSKLFNKKNCICLIRKIYRKMLIIIFFFCIKIYRNLISTEYSRGIPKRPWIKKKVKKWFFWAFLYTTYKIVEISPKIPLIFIFYFLIQRLLMNALIYRLDFFPMLFVVVFFFMEVVYKFLGKRNNNNNKYAW